MEAALIPPTGEHYRRLSLWWDGLPGHITVREPLAGDCDVDVVVVGGGFTGLWTAYYLAEADPRLRIAVLERDVAGFGASGRNGGWCSALFAVPEDRLNQVGGPGSGAAMRRAMVDSVTEVGAVAAAENIDCGFAHGGSVRLARTDVQLRRTREEVAAARSAGITEDDLALLSAAEASSLVGASDILGGTYHASLRVNRSGQTGTRIWPTRSRGAASPSTSRPRFGPSCREGSRRTGAR